MTRVLDREQLETLRARWLEAGSAIPEELRPGVDREDLVRRVGDREIVLPEELVTWWGWHDGADEFISQSREHYGIDQALAAYDMRIRVGYPETEMLPITSELPAILVECAGPGETGRVFIQYKAEDAELLFESFGELVDAWIELIACGRWVFDDRGDPRTIEEVSVPPALEHLG